MGLAVSIKQCGNGGAAVKSGRHASQKAAGGSGGGASIDQAPLGPSVDGGFLGGGLGDRTGELVRFGDEDLGFTELGSTKASASMVAAFNRGEINFTAALVIETAPDKYKPADAVSARILASARAAGNRDANVVIVPRSQQAAARRAQLTTGRSPQFGRYTGGGSFSAVGLLSRLDSNEVRGGSRPSLSQRQIDRAAREIRAGRASTWATVPVRQSVQGNSDVYTPVGVKAANALAIARRAGTEINAIVISD